MHVLNFHAPLKLYAEKNALLQLFTRYDRFFTVLLFLCIHSKLLN